VKLFKVSINTNRLLLNYGHDSKSKRYNGSGQRLQALLVTLPVASVSPLHQNCYTAFLLERLNGYGYSLSHCIDDLTQVPTNEFTYELRLAASLTPLTITRHPAAKIATIGMKLGIMICPPGINVRRTTRPIAATTHRTY